MQDEFEQTEAEATAAADLAVENEAPATSEAETPADTAEDVEAPAKPAKGVQKRIDELVRQREEERREKERLLALLEQTLPKPKPEQSSPADGKPTPDQFEDYESYLEALVDWKAEQKVAASEQLRERQSREQQRVMAFQEQASKAREQFPDFDAVVFNPALPISEPMQAVILDSDQGAALAYYLGQHPADAARIAKLPPLAAARELGRIEAMLAAPQTRKVTNAPDPITPVGLRETASRDPSKMSLEEWMAWRNTQLSK